MKARRRCTTHFLQTLLLAYLLTTGRLCPTVESACQSCVVSYPLRSVSSKYHSRVGAVATAIGAAAGGGRGRGYLNQPYSSSLIGLLALKRLRLPIVKHALILGGFVAARHVLTSKTIGGATVNNFFTTELGDDGDTNELDKQQKGIEKEEEAEENSKPVTSAMVATIGVYKNFISPLLPPACRFVPTCSQYGVQAIKEFGPSKGCILTAWRLLRCSPFGGKGYDPPKWPPVPYNYASY